MLLKFSGLNSLYVKLLLGGSVIASSQFRPRQQATIKGTVDELLLLAPWCFQNIIGNHVTVAGVADAQAQTPEIGCRQMRLDVFQAVVPAIAATLLQTDTKSSVATFV